MMKFRLAMDINASGSQRLKILLVAYEYPPVIAAQALRWYYLASELSQLGVQVHVLCPRFRSPLGSCHLPGNVVEHRVWPGPFVSAAEYLARRNGDSIKGSTAAEGAGPSIALSVYRTLRRGLDTVLYPDVRTEWYPSARRALGQLLENETFDAVISSHEPGVDLLLGLWVKRRYQLPWVVDLADPLCAPYSPKWRRGLDLRVERRVVEKADRIILTTESARQLLEARHGCQLGKRSHVIPQGGPEFRNKPCNAKSLSETMHIVFTGSFYEEFRNPGQLAVALRELASPEIALTVAGDNARFVPMFEGVPNVRFLGKLDHFDCLTLQQSADVLLNLANVQDYQMPGKIYEYLTAGKVVLHLKGPGEDPTETLLQQSGVGWTAENAAAEIRERLKSLLAHWRQGALVVPGEQQERLAAMHSWRARADALAQVLAQVV